MEASPQNLQLLDTNFKLIQTGEAAKIKQAEAFLEQAKKAPGFSMLLLTFLQRPDVADYSKLQGAIFFKNFVQSCWAPNVDEGEQDFISPDERQTIKSHIVQLMLSAPGPLLRQYQAALQIISTHDFPYKWETLLPQLVAKFASGDYAVINPTLRTIESVVFRYRHAFKSDDILRQLHHVLDNLQDPLLALYKQTCGLIAANITNGPAMKLSFTAVLEILRIWYSLNAVDLPTHFEDHMKDWLGEFPKFLQLKSELTEIVEGDDDCKPGLLHEIQAQICDNLALYAQKYETEFEEIVGVGNFVSLVWNLLVGIEPEEKFDAVVSSGIEFLSTVSRSVHAQLFNNPDVLKQVCEKIVIPNMKFTENDEMNFEENPIEYIRRDIEGSDTDTRRRASCNLIRGLRTHFEQQVTQICAGYVTTLLQQYTTLPPDDGWRSKDVAVYLVAALTVTQSTQQLGVVQANALVPIVDFFKSNILPELQKYPQNHHVIQADCLKFTSTFRNQLPAEGLQEILPLIIQTIASDSFVVCSYGAGCVERILHMKKSDGSPLISLEQLQPLLGGLLEKLFNSLQKPDIWGENEYVMRAIMRVIVVAKQGIAPLAAVLINQFTTILARVAPNPRNPQFNHYMFEGLAALVHQLVKANPATIAEFERLLFPPFQHVLEHEVVEFMPYIFQIMSLLVELNPGAPSEVWWQMYAGFVRPEMWEKKGNIPPLARLLQALITKGCDRVIAINKFEATLGCFQKVLAAPSHSDVAFELLTAITECTPTDVLGKYLNTINQLLLGKLSSTKSQHFRTLLVIYYSNFFHRHGVDPVIASIDSLGPGLYARLMTNVWPDNVLKVASKDGRMACALGMISILSNSATMLSDAYVSLWPGVLQTLVKLFELPQEEAGADEVDDESVGYQSVYSPLVHAMLPSPNKFPSLNPKTELAQKLHNFSKHHPGKITPLVGQCAPEVQTALQQYLQAAGVPPPFFA